MIPNVLKAQKIWRKWHRIASAGHKSGSAKSTIDFLTIVQTTNEFHWSFLVIQIPTYTFTHPTYILSFFCVIMLVMWRCAMRPVGTLHYFCETVSRIYGGSIFAMLSHNKRGPERAPSCCVPSFYKKKGGTTPLPTHNQNLQHPSNCGNWSWSSWSTIRMNVLLPWSWGIAKLTPIVRCGDSPVYSLILKSTIYRKYKRHLDQDQSVLSI